MVCDIVGIDTTTLVRVTRDNNTSSEKTFQRQEQDRDDRTGRYLAMNPTRDKDTGS